MTLKINKRDKVSNIKPTTKAPPQMKKKRFISFILSDRFIFFVGLISGMVTMVYLSQILKVPALPELHMDEYWGTYPMPDKPDTSIKPYTIEFSDAITGDLQERLLHTRKLPQPLDKVGFTYGFNSHFLNQVVDYWGNKYNYKERERFLNQYNHFTTTIQGLNIHYMHVKPKLDGLDLQVVPILLLHGWPGSIREFYELIPKLITPTAGKNFVFEVIAPSLPGFGFSEAPARPGFSTLEMAVLLHNLMVRVGFEQYYVHGGGLGMAAGSALATLFPSATLGLHMTGPHIALHGPANIMLWLGSWIPALVERPEMRSRLYPLADHAARIAEETGYLHLQSTRPDTIGAALSDSPAGLAAYILEKFSSWTNPQYKMAYDGHIMNMFSLTHLLDNVMIYWATNTITTSMRIYAETYNKRQIPMILDRTPTDVPTWGIKFKHDLIYQPDSILKMKYTSYLQSTVVDHGGHFAALENPDILAQDISDAVLTFREFHQVHSNFKLLTVYEVADDKPTTVYGFTVNTIHGNPISLEKYKGYVLLIVNVASQCGLTDTNYKELNQLHEKYHAKGLRILAFPCNQFNSQEPGNSLQILNFIKEKGVKFDLFEKVDVNGENASPLWNFLKEMVRGTLGDFIKWNFSKFIIDRNGVPVERLGPNINPMDLEPYLVKYL